MTIPQLEAKAKQLRKDVVRMLSTDLGGHIGGSCSFADIMAALYYHVMRYDPANPEDPNRDRFILSKGHSAPIQYAALLDLGVLPQGHKLKMLGSILQGHPDKLKTRGIEAGTGSLGQGLSLACGLAAGLRLDGLTSRVYVGLGDGEVAEGQVWEAALAAGERGFALDNLCAILDSNGIQANARLTDTLDTRPYKEKFDAFGWHAIELDGHDMQAILQAFDEAASVKGKPTILIAQTVKGKGFAFAEDNPKYHHAQLTPEQYEEAMQI